MARNADNSMLRRFLVACPLAGKAAGAVVALDAQESHHAARVLRLIPGTAIALFDGLGYSATATLRNAGHSRSEAIIDTLVGPAPRPTPRIMLAFAVPKGDRLDWLIEKATELGVDEFLPVRFARSVAGGDSFTAGKNARWQGHIVAASKQCGRAYLPQVTGFATPAALAERSHGAFSLMGCPAANTPGIATVLNATVREQTLLIIVGPEGGLTDEERRMLATAGIRPVRLGANVLRTETAALALLSAAVAATR